MKNFLEKIGLENIYQLDDFVEKNITLRDGRKAKLWVNKNDGHGILDPNFWENPEFYVEDYRTEFSATLDTFTSPEEHSKIYEKTNKRQFKQFQNKIKMSLLSAQQEKEIKEAFALLDENNDGFLQKRELKNLMVGIGE